MKVNENVNAANLLMVGMKASGFDSKNTDSSSEVMDFASTLSVASTNKADLSDVPSQSQNNNQKMKVKDTGENGQMNEKAQNVDTSSNDNKSVAEQTEIADKTATAKDSSVMEDDVYEEVAGELATLLENVAQILDIPVEELQNKLSELEMDVTEILNVDNLKEVLLDINQADSMELLTNEDLSNQLQQIIDEVETALDTLEELDVDFTTLPEKISLEDLEVTTEVTEEIVEVLPDTEEVSAVPDFDNEVSGTEVETDEPIVTIQDNRQTDANQNRNTSSKNDLPEKTVKHEDGKEIISDRKETTFENPILQGIQNSLDQIETVSNVQETANVNTAMVIDQIVEQVRISMNQDSTTLQMQLYPEHLGKILINVVSKDGVMTAHIVAENEAAKQAIEGGLASLKEAMEQQNIKVEAIEVMVSTTGFERGDESGDPAKENAKSKSKSKLNISELNEADLEAEDVAEVEKMKATGSSVSYSV